MYVAGLIVEYTPGLLPQKRPAMMGLNAMSQREMIFLGYKLESLTPHTIDMYRL
jgi:hypothetical protein